MLDLLIISLLYDMIHLLAAVFSIKNILYLPTYCSLLSQHEVIIDSSHHTQDLRCLEARMREGWCGAVEAMHR